MHRWLSLVIPGLLLLVAFTQLALVKQTRLSPWKGGGFGMFSTLDAPDARVIRLALELRAADPMPGSSTPASTLPASILWPVDVDRLPSSLRPALERLTRQPTKAHAEALAEALRDARWKVSTTHREAELAMTGLTANAVRLEVLRLRLDPETRELGLVPLLQYDGRLP
ncbi:hypothetical protein [Planctopirus hydrillae]|uniref:Uncharacterized protein n=1 Tax=Planctopirus hydrillae TaxID=1841610 RepID=A0A1C3E7P0_9PLAN|nr:hypothetical protein [Planctopirus hydrillae]ODA29169.1 hypothetical protein A6X21_09555 [Planctopirus hydrillae]